MLTRLPTTNKPHSVGGKGDRERGREREREGEGVARMLTSHASPRTHTE